MNGTPQGTSFQGRPVLVLAGGCEYMISLGAIFFRGAYLSSHTGHASAVNRPRRRPLSRCDLLAAPGQSCATSAIGTMAGGAALDEEMFLFFSNGFGVAGSIVVSVGLTLLLLYACSGP
jgi:hypothetical protein